MRHFSALFVLLSLGLLFSSCRKNELISEASIEPLRIDTLYYIDPGLGDAYLRDGELHPEPVLTDQYIYSLVWIERTSGETALVKFNRATGEVLWTWSDYATGDAGYPQSLVLSDGKVLLESNDYLYILHAEDGKLSFNYKAPPSFYLQSASLHQNEVYLSLSNNEEARLLTMHTDGSAQEVLLEIDSSYILARTVEILEFPGYELLLWEVSFRDLDITSTQLYYNTIGGSENFKKFVIGSGHETSSVKGARFLKDSESSQVFVHTGNDLTLCVDFEYYSKLNWIDIHRGDVLKQNTNTLYAFSRKQFAMYDKQTGHKLYTSEKFYKPFCVSDDFVLMQDYKGFAVYDAASMKAIANAGGGNSVHVMYHLGDNEFFFGNRDKNGRCGIGKLRITRIHP